LTTFSEGDSGGRDYSACDSPSTRDPGVRDSGVRDSVPVRVTAQGTLRLELGASTRRSLDALPNIVWLYDRELTLAFVNLAGRRLLGLSTGELVGQRDEDLFVSASTSCYLSTLQFAALNKRRAVSNRLVLQPRAENAKAVDCVLTFTPVLDEHEQLEWLVASANQQPATLLEPQAKPEAAAQSTQVQLVVAGFAHDINNLLTVVGHYQSFVAAGSLSAQQASDLQHAIEATQSGVALAGRLLVLCKGQRTTSALVDANEIVAAAVSMLRPVLGDAIQLSAELSPMPLPVRAGVGEVEQVIINLAFNSRDAMRTGPLLIRAFSATVLDHAGITGGLAPGKYAVISVKDAGPGMDEPTLARIFEPFFTTKALRGGTGLGLFMVKDVVTRLGGAVRIETAPGRGCEFFIYLPCPRPSLPIHPPTFDEPAISCGREPPASNRRRVDRG